MTPEYSVELDATYKTRWDDDFGARGWKLNSAVDDPMVIASTSETGDRLPTSVFVHDILDHHLCGLAMSGHRNEAVALTLLGLRTGISPEPDFTQMAEEDLLRGNVNGEPMKDFLPQALVQRVPKKYRNDNRLLMGILLGQLGEDRLKSLLVDHFHRLGEQGLPAARQAWQRSGLDFDRRHAIGLCIQGLLEDFDRNHADAGPVTLAGHFLLADDACALRLDPPGTACHRVIDPSHPR